MSLIKKTKGRIVEKKRSTSMLILLVGIFLLLLVVFIVYVYWEDPTYNSMIEEVSNHMITDKDSEQNKKRMFDWEREALLEFEDENNKTKKREFNKLLKSANKHASYDLISDNVNFPVTEYSPEDGSVLVKLPTFVENGRVKDKTKEEYRHKYIETVDNVLVEKNSNKIIVDLRNNQGGLEEVMVYALSSILPRGKDKPLYYLVPWDKNNYDEPCPTYLDEYKEKDKEDKEYLELKGRVENMNNWRKEKSDEDEGNKKDDKRDYLKIAILINEKTASAAEFLTLSLLSNKKYDEKAYVEVFGHVNSAGYTTANTGSTTNGGLSYPDAKVQDVYGNEYLNDPIVPTELVPEGEDLEARAREWINNPVMAFLSRPI